MTQQMNKERQFFRLEIRMEVKFKLLAPGEIDDDILFLNSHQGQIIDLSGGGALIVSNVFTPPDALLKVKLSNLGTHIPPVEASVVRVENLPGGSFKAAVKFVNIAESEVKKILNYLNQQLIKQTRKSH